MKYLLVKMYGEESRGDSYALEGQGGAPFRPLSSISEVTDKAPTYIEVYKGGK